MTDADTKLRAMEVEALINPRATMGGNNPPILNIVRENNDHLPDYLATVSPEVLKRFDDLMSAYERVPAKVDSAELNAQITDFTKKKIAACRSALEGLHTGGKSPYLEGGRIVDAFYLRKIDALKKATTDLQKRQTEWNVQVEAEERRKREEIERLARAAAAEAERIRRAEEERVIRERQAAEAAERERLAKIQNETDLTKALELEEENKRLNAEREARAKTASEEAARLENEAREAARLADAKSVELTRTRGSQGGVSSLRTEWKVEPEDDRFEKLDLNTLKAYFRKEDVQYALSGWLKPRAPKQGGIPPELPGARIWEHKFTR